MGYYIAIRYDFNRLVALTKRFFLNNRAARNLNFQKFKAVLRLKGQTYDIEKIYVNSRRCAVLLSETFL